MCTISKDIGINKEKEMFLPNKESISGHRCERKNVEVKCEMFVNCSINVLGICITAKQGTLKLS